VRTGRKHFSDDMQAPLTSSLENHSSSLQYKQASKPLQKSLCSCEIQSILPRTVSMYEKQSYMDYKPIKVSLSQLH